MTVARNGAPACNLRHRSGLQTSPASGCDRAPGGGTVTMGDRRARRRQDGDGGSLWSKMRGLHAFGMLQGNEKTIDDEVFQILPHKRSEEDIDKMVRETRHLSGIGTLPAPERYHLARVWTYEKYDPGARLCRAGDAEPALFIVLNGAVEVEEARLAHDLTDNVVHSEAARLRTVAHGVGKIFGRYPLLHDVPHFDCTARASGNGCGVLRVTQPEYCRILRRREEKELAAAVVQLRALPFFAEWTLTSLHRLYLHFERRKLHPGEELIKQGDEADRCFVISKGSCKVTVNTPAMPELGIPYPQSKLVADLPEGSLVGEAGLLSQTGKRTATVTAHGQASWSDTACIEVLELLKEKFLELDASTLQTLRLTAQYRIARTKDARLRTDDDLDLLQQRTAHLEYCKALPSHVHRELCRVMQFREEKAETVLYEKGAAVEALLLVMDGRAAVDHGQGLSPERGPPRRRASFHGSQRPDVGPELRGRESMRRRSLDSRTSVDAFVKTATLVERAASGFGKLMTDAGKTTRGQAGELGPGQVSLASYSSLRTGPTHPTSALPSIRIAGGGRGGDAL